ncbi:UDP-N-acetylglucosamine 2-epimerase [Roseospirillum parvum]|uniref:UDP-N-acetylglucosamine 2-epimerase (Non-hydrolysing) n=1 Tax=Roseospirillum parvum TaxID=83401 RepID=A0A1G7V098_9PROT|nr:UDP-N-acetylglucosamine 2-epimerase [Roseospirillum parvum]SDG53177.1 UDP-N-acetylglucosamine 2-epimerase (non-hydrolysing) [Roseospirillum parvum]
MTTRVLSVSTSRADLSILMPVWRALEAEPGVEPVLLLTGQHAAQADLLGDPPCPPERIRRGGQALDGGTPTAAARAMAAIGEATAAALAEVEPDVMLVIGDRLEMLSCATAALPFNTPLAHLHGGEISLGAVDDRIRHALSKLSHLHFVASVAAAEVLLASAEDPDRIIITGGPGLDTLRATPKVAPEVFKSRTGLDSLDGLRLVTLHPETNGGDNAALVAAVTSALAAVPAPTLVSAPNGDPGGAEMTVALKAWCARHPWAHWVPNLGLELYPTALGLASVMVGNSSSGIVEAGFVGLPVIDVGRRQAGRPRGRNVLTLALDGTPEGAPDGAALTEALRTHPRGSADDLSRRDCLYGDGHAAPRIAARLAALPPRTELLDKPLHLDPARRPAAWPVPWEVPA